MITKVENNDGTVFGWFRYRTECNCEKNYRKLSTLFRGTGTETLIHLKEDQIKGIAYVSPCKHITMFGIIGGTFEEINTFIPYE